MWNTSSGPAACGVSELLAAVTDPGSFVAWDDDGAVESVVTGAATLRGRRIALAVSDFDVAAGSVGAVAAARLIRALDRAREEGLPFLAAPASGGTRMGEGTAAFLTMVPIARAIAEFKAVGLPYLVYLRHPTTGGALASWGSAGHFIAAAPGALVGFLGPRVYGALTGCLMPPGVQVAENLHAHGVIDTVVAPDDLALLLDRFLGTVAAGQEATRSRRSRAGVSNSELAGAAGEAQPRAGNGQVAAGANVGAADAWDTVRATRDARRDGIRDLLACATGVVELAGSGEGDSDPGVVVALARFGGIGCLLAGHDRDTGLPVAVAGLRVLRRGIRLAGELRLPLVTVIDTAGAELSQRAEEAGLAWHIAQCMSELVHVSTPSISILLGQGAGGAAIALLPADRVIAAENGWLAPLAPEGASAIVHRDRGHAPEMARAQGITASHLLRLGVLDRMVAEHGAASRGGLAGRMAAVLGEELGRLAAEPSAHVTARSRTGRMSRMIDGPAARRNGRE